MLIHLTSKIRGTGGVRKMPLAVLAGSIALVLPATAAQADSNISYTGTLATSEPTFEATLTLAFAEKVALPTLVSAAASTARAILSPRAALTRSKPFLRAREAPRPFSPTAGGCLRSLPPGLHAVSPMIRSTALIARPAIGPGPMSRKFHFRSMAIGRLRNE
jgi:hypothetical protein